MSLSWPRPRYRYKGAGKKEHTGYDLLLNWLDTKTRGRHFSEGKKPEMSAVPYLLHNEPPTEGDKRYYRCIYL